MAIKISNQITITEHKKIIEIKEWYLATPDSKSVTHDTNGWDTVIPTIDNTNRYLWNYEEVIYSLGSSDVSEPVIIGVYGDIGASLQIKYISSEIMPTIVDNNVSAWFDTVPTPQDGKNIYMIQKLSTDINWSAPIQISSMAAPTVEIVNGYWYVDGEATGVKAEGSDGDTPSIAIGGNGNWFIDGVDSGVKAEGPAGQDGSGIEYVYYRSKEEGTSLENPSYTNGVLTSGWTASPQGITITEKYEYVSVRTKPIGGSWSEFSSPVIWSKWGEKGQDGDGVEYKYYLKNNNTVPTYSAADNKWTDDPTGVSIDNQYEYVIQIKTINGVSTPAEKASLWAKYGADGANGKGISDITNYYTTTASADDQPLNWDTSVPALTPTNKYLWNYEEITYTDNSKTQTTAAIIGAYGDSGSSSTDAVDFQIYSVDGFEFSEDVASIELKTVVLKVGSVITSGVKYQWYWYDGTGYVEINNAVSSVLQVKNTDEYAFSSIKCVMTYNEIPHEDYVTLTEKLTVYTSTIKFFGGSNIFSSADKYLIAYVELYKNGSIEESIVTNQYSSANSITGDGIINTDLTGNFSDGTLMYFIYADGDDYGIVLGKYEAESWSAFNKEDSKYVYSNTFKRDVASNIFAISRNYVSRSAEISATVSIKDIGTEVSRTSAMVIDTNDPIISDEVPSNVKDGQLWLNTSSEPYQLYVYTINDGKWKHFNQQNGGIVHTSKPDSYKAGDIWILAYGEECGDYKTEGTLLKSIVTSNVFDEHHWVDAMNGIASTIKNIKETFTWSNDGLYIRQQDIESDGTITNPFYVHLDSKKMGFHSVSEDFGDQEVVHIGNNSAEIQNATFKGESGTTFNNDAVFNKNVSMNGQCSISKKDSDNGSINGFVFKIEDNGSLSLILMNQ